ncbi:MAG: dihydropteroate synthase [Gammaproteobacteria bacterium]
MRSSLLTCGGRVLDLSRPHVMGILNVTPDSFSDGGRFVSRDAAVAQARAMVEQGATLVDVGGESTRPGALAVSEQEELDRVIPVIEQIRGELDVAISVDTSTPAVMVAAADAGAHLINDVRALRRPGALEAAAASGLSVCLMHMQGEPGHMQQNPRYVNVVQEVMAFLQARVQACIAAGIPASNLLIDPGFGFGKSVQHNLQVMHHLEQLRQLPYPMLVGVSRKSMVGAVLDRPVDQRLIGSIALAVIAVQKGACIIRAHDVEATVDAVRMTHTVMQESLDQETGLS